MPPSPNFDTAGEMFRNAEHLTVGRGEVVDALLIDGSWGRPQPPLDILQDVQPLVRASEGKTFEAWWRTPLVEPISKRCSALWD
ncbi:MAG: hypothetical protein ACFB4J_07860 [Elainellaceae cyanobacterium]